ncbi:MAG: flavodoxin family protein [Tractidigestivibacter sp.]|jgi:flavodoxin|uniref:flavodoxin family protein n=1 Tax=Tractidigestivibacter sp. TaxID=2847320 RepID=UPI003D8C20E0
MPDTKKTVIVYYSLTGNCEAVANELADVHGADKIRLQPNTEPPKNGIGMYAKGGAAALRGARPMLMNSMLDVSGYENVILVAPVWAGKLAPAMGSFVERAMPSGKKVGIVVCSKSGRGDGVISYLREKIEPGSKVVAALNLVEPLSNMEAMKSELKDFGTELF